ncbi:MAG: nicotinamide mononucleotide transporter family protein, partial [Nocardioidaceae bacterium]
MLHWLLEGTVSVGGGTLLVREIVGNGFGIASAVLGSRRSVVAWPVGIVGNLILFTVFVGGVLAKPQVHDLWGQAGRQVFFVAVSVYGWNKWRQRKSRREASDGKALVPTWAGRRGLLELAVLAVVGMAVFYPV